MKNEQQTVCFMCGKPLLETNVTKEHVFPKWLLQKCSLYDDNLSLVNGEKFPYRQLTIPCCRECNGGRMAAFENTIKAALLSGLESVKSLDERILVWWLAKIFYAVRLKETTLNYSIKEQGAKKIINPSSLHRFQLIHFLMQALINDETFDADPYEIFIFKSKEERFDYCDFAIGDVSLIQLGDIICVCSFSSGGFCKDILKNDISYLNSKESIFPAQAYEFLFKMYWFILQLNYSYDLVKIEQKNVLKIHHKEVDHFDFHGYNDLIMELWSERCHLVISDKNIPEGRIITLLDDDAFKTTSKI